MNNFQHRLHAVVSYTQKHVNPSAFAIYHLAPSGEIFLTIAALNPKNGELQVYADIDLKAEDSFTSLYTQINNYIHAGGLT